ncbi:IS110 family transposase [Nonomuraea sp. ZG12]|uniref:IS110 family transposase n=1 Tax=Nonomuraea sp. ZG12 TaxID=3452207 RepID=UPI003F8C4859
MTVPGEITGGIDTHRDSHTAAALDSAGRVLGTGQVSATAAGYATLLAWLRAFGTLVLVGIEDTGAYRAGQADPIAAASLTRPSRPRSRCVSNAALYRIVLCRMRWDARTRNYVERRTKDGLSKTEIIRCLKRYAAREIYRILMPRAEVPNGHNLAA